MNLRGAIRGRIGESAKREGQNIFDILTGVAITLLVRNPENKGHTEIKYYDIGDYKTKSEKLNALNEFKSLTNSKIKWANIQPNSDNDWINKRSNMFQQLIPIAPDKKFNSSSSSFFVLNSLGVNSNRDAWVINSSTQKVEKNVSEMINFYNKQVDTFHKEKKSNPKIEAKNFIDNNPKKISWSSSLLSHLQRGNKTSFDKEGISKILYRPFNSQRIYFGEKLIHRRGQNDQLYLPNQQPNFAIITPGKSERRSFATLITNVKADLNMFDGGCQCFPLYYYEKREKKQGSLFDEAGESEYIRRDGVSDFILERAKKQYGKSVTKEDIFYYVYGILHNEDYREAFTNDLKKMLPRIPLVDVPKDFWTFSKTGRELADLHINYESIPAYEGVTIKGIDSNFYKVEKMRFAKKRVEIDGKSKTVDDKSIINFNSKISILDIPEQAYEYMVNGKSAIEWVMERYQVKADKASGIKNDPNDWAEEQGNPKYILDLLLSVINVSVQSVDLVKGLPKLKFE